MKYLLGALALLFLIMFSGVVVVYVFSGLLMFGGIVALCESIKPLKYFVSRSAHLVDFVIFAFGIYAMSRMGVTVAIGLGVAGLLFSVYYKPYLRGCYPRPRKGRRSGIGREYRLSRSELWQQ